MLRVPNDLIARIHKHLKARGVTPLLRPYYVEAVTCCAVGRHGAIVYSMAAVCSPLFAAGSAVNNENLQPFVDELARRKLTLDREPSIT